MRMLVMLFALTSFMACNSNSVPEKSEPGKTVVVKSISLNDSTINVVSSLFDQYESLKNGLVDYNIPAVDSSATFLSSILNKFSISGIQDAALTDSIHYSIKNMEASVNAILAKGSIEALVNYPSLFTYFLPVSNLISLPYISKLVQWHSTIMNRPPG
ncbi:MAG: hypothetical protein ACO23V_05325 [Chitinophagaceae bacterium]